MNFANNEEAGPSGIVVKEEMETDEEAGIKIICFSIYNIRFVSFICYLFYLHFSRFF